MDLCDECLCAIAEIGTQDVQREKGRVVSKSYCLDCYHVVFFGKMGNSDKANGD